jgi:hypothetical protein
LLIMGRIIAPVILSAALPVLFGKNVLKARRPPTQAVPARYDGTTRPLLRPSPRAASGAATQKSLTCLLRISSA